MARQFGIPRLVRPLPEIRWRLDADQKIRIPGEVVAGQVSLVDDLLAGEERIAASVDAR